MMGFLDVFNWRDVANFRAGSTLTWCSEVTLDSVVESIGCKPALLKIDVEGYEAHVLRGARVLLESPNAPVICFELNPKTEEKDEPISPRRVLGQWF